MICQSYAVIVSLIWPNRYNGTSPRQQGGINPFPSDFFNKHGRCGGVRGGVGGGTARQAGGRSPRRTPTRVAPDVSSSRPSPVRRRWAARPPRLALALPYYDTHDILFSYFLLFVFYIKSSGEYFEYFICVWMVIASNSFALF